MDKRQLNDEPRKAPPKEAQTPGEEKLQAQRKTEDGAEVARKVAGGSKDETADRTGRYR